MTDPRNPLEFLKNAMGLASGNRLDEALRQLEEGLTIVRADPQQAKTGSLLAKNAGLLSIQAGRVADGVRYYTEALVFDPGDAYQHWALGELLQTIGEDAQARTHWATFEKLAEASQDPDLCEFLARHKANLRRS